MGPKGTLRVVFDTNVVISALRFGRGPGEIVELWKAGAVVPLVSREIVEEYIRVLSYPKFGMSSAEILELFQDALLPFAETVEPDSIEPVIRADPSDDKFLACATSAKADAIVSGDRHLLGLKAYRGIRILRVRDFLMDLQP